MSSQPVSEIPIQLYHANGEPLRPGSALELFDELAAIGRSIPDEEWANVPHDGSINLDHYLYGSPKLEPDKE